MESMLELDRFLPYLVNKLASRLSVELAAVYQKRFGITIPEWRVIAHLAENRNVSIREIFVRVAMDKSKVSRAAARLELSGFVKKTVNSTDRRLIELQLTPKGQKLFEKIEPLALAYERDALAALSPREAELFRTLIGKLLAARVSARP
jgi:DNA-binding MarR family transcriptional regulator